MISNDIILLLISIAFIGVTGIGAYSIIRIAEEKNKNKEVKKNAKN